MQVITAPDKGEKIVYVSPKEEIQLKNIDAANLKIDVLGADFIITNIETGARLVFPNLGLILFSPEDAPKISINGAVISADDLLNDVGIVENITQSDLLSFTSLNTNPEQGTSSDQLGTQGRQEELTDAQSEEDASKKEDYEALLYDIASFREPPGRGQLEVGPNNASDISSITEVTTETETAREEAKLEFKLPPEKKQLTTTPKQSDFTQENPEEIDIDLTIQIFNFDAALVQRAATSGTEDVMGTDYFVYRGGGGNESSAFIADNTAQYSSEVIDVTAQTGQHYVFGDDPNFFADAQMSRVILLTPSIADGFDITNIDISGLPVGYVIDGAVFDSGTYSIATPTRQADGTIRITLNYPVPGTDAFTLDISATAEYDPLSGAPVPEITEVVRDFSRDVILRDVNSSADYDAGADTWVLANNPNANRIFTGTGDAIVTGTFADESVTSFGGNDIINASGGNDIIRSGSGNDIINPGTGNNFVDGDLGIDTIVYDDRSDNISANLSTGISVNITVGAATDQVSNIENITGGSGNDTLIGSSVTNILIGGAGNDTIQGGLGDDDLQGGDGIDTINYDYSTLGITLNLGTADGTGNVNVNIAAGDQDIINGFENIIGTNQNDTLTGDSAVNIINGGGGNDVLSSGGGIDFLDGGAGSDTISYLTSVPSINFDLSIIDTNGFATVNYSDGGSEFIKSIETIQDSQGDDVMRGDATDNIFGVSEGTDTIDGGGGLNDSVSYSNLGGSLNLNLVTGTSLDYQGRTDTITNVEIFTLSNNDDSVTLSAGNDRVFGLNGDDIFLASSGDDILDAGSSNSGDLIDYSLAPNAINANLITGVITGWGTDTVTSIEKIIATDFDDFITIQNVNFSSVQGGIGNDTVSVSYASSLSTNLQTLDGNGFYSVVTNSRTHLLKDVENITGTSGSDTFRGDDSNNIFDSGDGNDTFRYSLGNDIFISGNGFDTADYRSATNAITVDLSTLNGSARSVVTFSGLAKTDELSQISRLYGSSVDDNITGSTGNDTLLGDTGNDIIRGGNGNDTLSGNAGADQVFGDAGNDRIIGDTTSVDNDTYDGGTGTDTLDYSSSTNSISFNISGGVASGSSIGTDNFSNFSIYEGGSAGDTFTGGVGNDTMRGNNGNDVFRSSNGNDTLSGGSNNDTADYTGEIAGISLNINTNQITKGSGTDTLSSIETIEGTSQNDNFLLNNNTNLLNYSAIRGNGGTDTIIVTSVTDFEGVNLAAFFSDIEEIDFTGSSLVGADTFDINGDNVKDITNSNDLLHIEISAGFAVNVSSGSTYALTATSTVGATTTYTFDNAGDAVTLEVQTV